MSHKKCENILEARRANRIVESAQTAESRFVERHKENIEATAKVFRTAYECAQSHLPFSEHPRLIALQSLNGIQCGNILYSNHARSNIVAHISSEMRSQIVNYVVQTGEKFSFMVDESTSVANTQSMIVYIGTKLEDSVCTYFLALLEIEDASACGLEKTLVDFLHEIGFSEELLRNQFTAFCSDGASCMIGQHKGLATLLKSKYPQLHTFHCMAHRLELAVKNTVDTINAVSHFRIFVDELYKVYSTSPKNQRELNSVSETLCVELLKVQKVFDARWVFSSFVAVKAVLRNFAALHQHFSECASMDSARPSKEKRKYSSLASKLQSWFFVAETCMLKDALRCIKQLSLFLQSNNATIVDAVNHIDSLKSKLMAMKTENRTSLAKFFDSYNDEKQKHQYKCIEIVQNESDLDKFSKMRGQFLQSLIDNFEQRFPYADFFTQDAACLNPLSWPDDPLQKALFGERSVAKLCKGFGISSSEAALTVVDYAVFKQSSGAVVGNALKHLPKCLDVLPISSADCERGFSQMNLYHTSGRNRLLLNSCQ